MCIAINCWPVCDVINFEIILSLLIKPFFYITKTLRQNVNISRTKRAFNITLKAFSSFLKSSQLSVIASNEEGRLKSYLRFGGPVSARSHHSSTPWFHRSKMKWFWYGIFGKGDPRQRIQNSYYTSDSKLKTGNPQRGSKTVSRLCR